jgi:hypothetical protein
MQNKKLYFSSRHAKVQWFKEDREIDTNSLSTPPYRLVFKKTSASDEGWYTCRVSNNFTTISQKAFLNVRGKTIALLKYFKDDNSKTEEPKSGVIFPT